MLKKRVLSFLLSIILIAGCINYVPLPAEAADYEYAWFPAPRMQLTQIAYESYSHGSQNAIDIAPGGNVFAPFTGRISYVDSRWGYAVLQSSDKVYYADGTLDYMTVAFMHDENISDLYEGKVISQGTAFYQAGGMGSGNPDAYADHVHMSVHRGKVSAITGSGKYGAGDVYAYNAFYINSSKTTNIVNKGVMESGNYMTNGAPSNWNNLWKNLSDAKVTVIFDANGGSCATSSKSVTTGGAIGTLPMPTRAGYNFAGWYTGRESGGDPITADTVVKANTTYYALWANQVYKGNCISFEVNNGTIDGSYEEVIINGMNIGRGAGATILYTCGNTKVATNYYGEEIAVDASGKITAYRAYGDSTNLTVPEGGFVLSAHSDAGAIFSNHSLGSYVGFETVNGTTKAYRCSNYDAYLLKFKYVENGNKYGTLPVVSGEGGFRGWYSSIENGDEITAESIYSTPVLYAQWGCSHDYMTEKIPATCEDYEKIRYTCSKCGDTYVAYAADTYTEWSEKYPEGVDESRVETKKQYRYSDYETKTSYETSLSGWTQLSGSWQQNGSGTIQYVKSWPAGFYRNSNLYTSYNKTPKTATESLTDKTVINSDKITGYIYYHWCRGTYTNGPINRTTKNSQQGEYNTFHGFYSTTSPSSLTAASDGDGSYRHENGSCCTDSYWYFYVPVYTQTYTAYKKLFTYYRWTDWSAWSDAVYTAGENRQVETKTLYRYATGASEWSETYPENADSGIVQTKQQYRYADKERKTAYSASLDGYSLVSKSWQKSGDGTIQYIKNWPSGFYRNNNLYTSYNKTAKTASETETDKIVINSDKITGYIYYHWCRGSYTGGPINRTTKNTQQGEYNSFHAFYSTTNPNSLIAASDGDGSYNHSNASCCTDSYWYFVVPVYTQSYTTYRMLFTYEKWTEWSAWSDTVYSGSETRKVEVRILYRTVNETLGAHVWNDGSVIVEPTCTKDGLKTYTCNVCGDTKTENIEVKDHRYEQGYCKDCGAANPGYNFIPTKITVGEACGYPGEEVTLPVMITDNSGFAGFTICVSYNDEALELIDFSKGQVLQISESGAMTENPAGGTINWNDSQNTIGNGVLMYLTFRIKSGVPFGQYEVSMYLREENAKNFVDENSRAKNVEFETGFVSVEEENTFVAEGYCGDTIQWTLDQSGVLTFAGSGNMRNYTYKTEMPWSKYSDRIKRVVIGDGINSIGDYAFYGMNHLESISIPDTVKIIGDYAFKNASALDNVVLPEGLTKLGQSAFYACESLSSIEIPESLWTIQPYTFKNCTSLESVTLNEGNLQKISDAAFYNTGLRQVKLPDCLDILDVYVFKNCGKLSYVKIGSDMTTIREAAFYGTNLTAVEIPEGITSIGPYAFKNCKTLVSVKLPKTLVTVGEAAFYECADLEKVDFPDSVTKIEDYAFRKCYSLSEVSFGENLKVIGECAFYGCEELADIIVPQNVTEIKAYAFKTCVKLESVLLPESLTALGESAFHTCELLERIVIPSKVVKVGEYCFSGCIALREVVFEGDAPEFGNGVFNKISTTVYYPNNNSTWTDEVKQQYGGTVIWEIK